MFGSESRFLVILNMIPHLMLSSIYLVVVVGKAIIPYPNGEVRGQQAVP